jgi:polyisoprenoid-binding protein YceI
MVMTHTTTNREAGVRGKTAAAALETWRIDASHSTLKLSLRHLVIGEIRGRFARWGGELVLDPKNVDASRVDVWVDLASLDTGDAERDAHVRSAEFFDVARHPRAEFHGTHLVTNADGSARLSGTLRLRGVSGAVELALEDYGTRTEAGRSLRTCVARGKLDRQAFVLHWNQDLDVGGVVVGDEVRIEARVELVRDA